MEVHRLDANAAWTREAVPDHVAAAAEDTGLQAEHLHLHADGLIAVDPATRLDVDLFVLCQLLLEDIAVAMQPEHTLLMRGAEAIDEKPGGAEQHVADALDPGEGVVEVAGCRQELVLAD